MQGTGRARAEGCIIIGFWRGFWFGEEGLEKRDLEKRDLVKKDLEKRGQGRENGEDGGEKS